MAKLQLGGLWFRTAKDGTEYLTGTVNADKIREMLETIDGSDKFYLNLYPNGYKEAGDNKPDWVLYINTPLKEGEEAPAPKETKALRNMKAASPARSVGLERAGRSAVASPDEIDDPF